MRATGSRAVVIGVGSEFRRDDGVGPAVVEALRERDLPARVRLVVSDGEPTTLLDAWTGTDLAIVVDAVCLPRTRPGRVHRTTLSPRPDHATGGTSSHGLGVPDAVALGEVLGRAPRRLVVHAVEVADVGIGPGLSAAVRAAVPRVARAVLADLGALSEREP